MPGSKHIIFGPGKNASCIIGHWTCVSQNLYWFTYKVLLYTHSGAHGKGTWSRGRKKTCHVSLALNMYYSKCKLIYIRDFALHRFRGRWYVRGFSWPRTILLLRLRAPHFPHVQLFEWEMLIKSKPQRERGMWMLLTMCRKGRFYLDHGMEWWFIPLISTILPIYDPRHIVYRLSEIDIFWRYIG